MLEFSASIFLVFALHRGDSFDSISNYVLFLLVLAMVCSGELLRRWPPVTRFIFRAFFSLKHRLFQARISWVKILHLLFYILVIVFIVAEIKILNIGIKQPLSSTTSGANDLITTVLTLATAIASIFFAGASFVIQFIAGSYSHRFTKSFLANPVVTLSFALLIVITIGNFVFLWQGVNDYITQAILYSGIFVVLDLAIVTLLIGSRYSDLPSIIQETGAGVRRMIKRRVRSPIYSFAESLQNPDKTKFANSFPFLLEYYILGKVKNSEHFPGLVIPEEISDSLKEETREFFSIAADSIRRDRREILKACLNQIELIVLEYYYARKKFSDPEDRFSIFLSEQMQALLELAVSNLNQQYTADLVEASARMGSYSLELTQTRINQSQNSISTIWTDLLAQQAIQTMGLMRSYAPTLAANQIGKLTASLVRQGAYVSAFHGSLEHLKLVGLASSSSRGLWPSVITSSVLQAHMAVLQAHIETFQTEQYNYEFACRNICSSIYDILMKFAQSQHNYSEYEAVCRPLVGGVYGANFGHLFAMALKTGAAIESERSSFLLLRDARTISDMLYRIVLKRPARSNLPLHLFAEMQAEMSWDIVQALQQSSNQHLSKELMILFEKTSLSALDVVISCIDSEEHEVFHVLQSLSAVPAFLVYFSSNEPVEGVAEIRDKVFKQWLVQAKVYQVAGVQKDNDQVLFFRYLKLFGAWVFRCDRENSALDEVRNILSAMSDSFSENGFYNSEYEEMGYPTGIGQNSNWWLFPSDRWPSKQAAVIDFLNDIQSFREFDGQLRPSRS
ncbi:MAG: hypothetical protein KIT70_09635 [Anaerolineales bacterium]|nr:MAG: hypothetical protein KIT70_09635 [Anaerolineales bacterium]